MLHVPMPLSEVVDRLTILDLKLARVADPARRAVAERWRDALYAAWAGSGLPDLHLLPEHGTLAEVNAALWDVEDRLRAREAAGDFGADFVADARAVYALNDRRASLKSTLDLRLGSGLADVKAYDIQ